MFLNDTNYLDQHFLIDINIINEFIKISDIKKTDIVVEIGAGKGVITKLIAPISKKLIVIEKDKRLSEFLDNIENIKVIYDSILNINIPKCNKIITSLPYSITEPFIYKLIDSKFDKLIMICGLNYANNVINNKITKLSLLTNLFFNFKFIKDIAPSSFEPQPRVYSALVTIENKKIDELTYNEKILRYLYNYKYLKIKNALREIYIKLDSITKKEAKEKINKLNINEEILNKEFDAISNIELEYIYKLLMQ